MDIMRARVLHMGAMKTARELHIERQGAWVLHTTCLGAPCGQWGPESSVQGARRTEFSIQGARELHMEQPEGLGVPYMDTERARELHMKRQGAWVLHSIPFHSSLGFSQQGPAPGVPKNTRE